jgi:uroporphyrinogen decarboxylase
MYRAPLTKDEVKRAIDREYPPAAPLVFHKWIDAFYRPEGGLLLAAGNGILPDTPLENIRAMLEEITVYGTEVYRKKRSARKNDDFC